uniref:Uncharacterized protein n=1 Tax=Anopheles atroparvus TaxID=41427 RepID=A0AAG5DX71_ANOAO
MIKISVFMIQNIFQKFCLRKSASVVGSFYDDIGTPGSGNPGGVGGRDA